MSFETRNVDTLVLHGGGFRADPATGATTVPIYQSVSFDLQGTARAERLANLAEIGFMYTRVGNPTQEALEQRLAALEGGAAALALASGQAATAIAVLTLVQAGDNIVSGTALALEAELGVTIITLHCEGFKSKHWSSGWDVIEHGILRRLVRKDPPARQADLINVIHLGGPDVFSPLLEPLGLRVNLVMGGSPLDRLARMSEATATATMCFVLSYLATGLEQEYGVPEVKAPLPYGLDATDEWLRDIARMTGREDRVEALIARERARVAPELARLRRALAGKRGFVAAGAAFAHGLLADLRELGVTVDAAYSFHHDPSTDSGDPRQDSLSHLVETWGDVAHFTVSPDQHFQAHAALQRAKPDFVICRHTGSIAALAGRLGIPVLPIFYSNDGLGYDGLITIGRAILRILPRRRFYQDVAAHSSFPYQRWWKDETNPYALSLPAA